MVNWLLVEDEPDLHDASLGMFELWGISGTAFTNGLQAVEWINRIDSALIASSLAELALIDMRLPEVSGIDVARQLRNSERLSNVGIVLMTAYYLSPDEERTTLERAKANMLIYKPLPDLERLRMKLESVVQKSPAVLSHRQC